MISKINGIRKLFPFFFVLLSCGLFAQVPWTPPIDLSSSLSGSGERPEIAISESGYAVAIWKQNSGTRQVYAAIRSPSGTWELPELVGSAGTDGREAVVTIDGAGNSLAMWGAISGGTFTVYSSYRPLTGTWSAPHVVASASGSSSAISLEGNSSGYAVGVFGIPSGGSYSVRGAVFNGSEVPSSTSVIKPSVPSTPEPAVAVNAANDAVAVWNNNGVGIESSMLPFSGAWTSPTLISTSPSANMADVAIDGSGNAVAVWRVGGVARASTYVGGVWGAPTSLSPSGGNVAYTRVAITPSGDAVVVWERLIGGSYDFEVSEQIVPGAWSSPVVIDFGSLFEGETDVTIADDGTAYAVYVYETALGEYEIRSVYRPAGGTWSTPETISFDSSTIPENYLPHVEVDPTNTYLAAVWWGSPPSTSNYIIYSNSAVFAPSLPEPPQGIFGRLRSCDYALLVSWYNEISWSPSITADVVGYRIDRNGVFFKQVGSEINKIYDYEIQKGSLYTYTVRAIDSSGVLSIPITYTVRP